MNFPERNLETVQQESNDIRERYITAQDARVLARERIALMGELPLRFGDGLEGAMADEATAIAQRSEALEDATRHYRNNPAELFDLARLDASLDGVQITMLEQVDTPERLAARETDIRRHQLI